MAAEGGLLEMIDQVAREKGLDRKVLIETMEAAILKAAQAAFGPTREMEARLNEETGQIDLFQYMTVVEEVEDPENQLSVEEAERHGLEAEVGEELGFQVFWHPRDAELARQQDKDYGELLDMKQARSSFGRIAAQTAKQVLLQRVRDAERDIIYNEFKDKQGELIRGIVHRFERGHSIIVDLGKTEAVLPNREQTPRESYRPGDRIVAYVKNIDREARGPMVILSRSSPYLVEKLFQAEVPEISEGIVKVVAVAREAGSRTKIAVQSRSPDVDPVGACVGIKGSRVQAVVQELRGEKIDIVPYDEDPARYIINAIQPADVNKVIVDEADHRMELIVPDEKLSLAIGRKGQNVRLAAQLTGWKLDIISESKFKQIEEDALGALREIEGVDEEMARSFYRLGFRALEEVAEASTEELFGIEGISSAEVADAIRASALTSMERLRQERLASAHNPLTSLTERDKLRLVRGIGVRTLQLLEEAGYRTVRELAAADPELLAKNAGLDPAKAEEVHKASIYFLEHDLPEIQRARARADQQSEAQLAADED
ncbi:MAG: antitermination protein NusA [Sorangiineae bacterium NIC37A_2]|jgi:N utilization substance protein A|nr:MAG: antitermination protein NusA [Sorangiineae bacterium NIC37A_2]